MDKSAFDPESPAQKIALSCGFKSIAWSLRRLHCPVDRDALVLEVGSGGNPLPRSNVLVDAYVETRERHWAPLRADRPTVLALGENLPFKDKAFDFVVACHVLEHSKDPDRFLSELQRVGKAGYIETPDAFMERINPYRDHRLEVTVRDGTLILRKKAGWIAEPGTVALYEDRAKALLTREVMPKHPQEFHTRYYWRDEIRWRVENPEVDAAWPAPPAQDGARPDDAIARPVVLGALQWFFSQRARNRALNILSLLQCPDCRRGGLDRRSDEFVCRECRNVFKDEAGLPRLIA